jgi:hypothetical protein
MAEFESLAQVISSKRIDEVLRGKVLDKERRLWLFEPYLSTDFSEEFSKVRDLFPDDSKRIHPAMH